MSYQVGETWYNMLNHTLYVWNGSVFTMVDQNLSTRTPVEQILYRTLEKQLLLEIKQENDCFRVYSNDIIIREIAPYETRRVTCFFEEKQYFELSRDDLEILLKSMKGTEINYEIEK